MPRSSKGRSSKGNSSNSNIKVAFIGSSGGGCAGFSNREVILSSIEKQLQYIGVDTSKYVTMVYSSLIISDISFDFAEQSSHVSVYVQDASSSTNRQETHSGTLHDMNKILEEEDSMLAALIRSGQVDALISVSSDPQSVNRYAVLAAIARDLPIVGTGGKFLLIYI